MITRAQIEALLDFTAGSPVVSFYLEVGPPGGALSCYPARAEALLRQAHEALALEVGGRWSKSEVDSGRVALERIGAYLREEFEPEGVRGLAVFCCHGEGGPRDDALWQALPLAVPVRDRLVLQSHPYVRPLVQTLEEAPRYGVALVGREDGQLLLIAQNEIALHERIQDAPSHPLRSVHRYGLADKRVERPAEACLHRHLKRMAAHLEAFVERHGLERVLIGGPLEATDEFERCLPRWVQRKVQGWLPDLHDATPAEVLGAAQQAVQAADRVHEATLVTQALEQSSRAGFAVVGVEATLEALYRKAVQTLLIERDHAVLPGFACRACDRLFVASEPSVCPACGHRHAEAVGDVLEEAVDAALREDAEVVCTETGDTRPEWLGGAQGVGALLRYLP